jgi:hypothetical protein
MNKVLGRIVICGSIVTVSACRTTSSNSNAELEGKTKPAATVSPETQAKINEMAYHFVDDFALATGQRLEDKIRREQLDDKPNMASKISWARSQVQRMQSANVLRTAARVLSYHAARLSKDSKFDSYTANVVGYGGAAGFGFQGENSLDSDEASLLSIVMVSDLVKEISRMSSTGLGKSLSDLKAASAVRADLAVSTADLSKVAATTMQDRVKHFDINSGAGLNNSLKNAKKKIDGLLDPADGMAQILKSAEGVYAFAVSGAAPYSSGLKDQVAEMALDGFDFDVSNDPVLAIIKNETLNTSAMNEAAKKVVDNMK